ncbi:MAG: hypothetical protein GY796_03230 [Chloroflexi bacterium]|nr:hypothetical protein [Chloroflexota bacterium]
MMEQIKLFGSHDEIGLAIGERFACQIHSFLDAYPFMQKLLAYHQTAGGKKRYRQYLNINRQRYPDYVIELEGIARGAGRPFHHLFLVNMRGEYRDYLREHHLYGCSDLAVLTANNALIGHNEDGDIALADTAYLVQAQVPGQPAFTAFSYPGFLCGNAFGFNSAGICFSVDNVRPRHIEIGIGRHFIARSLLAATSLEDAVARATAPGRAGGFSYTIGSANERRIVVVETAPGNRHHVREVEGIYYHANHYLDVEMDEAEQHIGKSSRERVKRASELMQSKDDLDKGDVLAILNDCENEAFPICRTAVGEDSLATVCTAVFDFDRHQCHINPGPVGKKARPVTLAIL